MKDKIRFFFQKIFGFQNYLFLFSLYSINRLKKNYYEKEFLYFVDLLDDDGVILDIGANIGITMVPIAQKKKKAEIHAYEPIKENFSNLLKMINWFKLSNVRLFNTALGSSVGYLEMIMPVKGKAKMQGMSKVYQLDSDKEGIIYKVPVNKLDNIYEEHTNITAIKIDVENYEYEVLVSGRNLLERCNPIIYCELWNNEKRTLVFDFFNSLKYSAFILNEAGTTLEKVSDILLYTAINFFFIPDKFKQNLTT